MNDFETGADVLFNDPNRSKEAQYRAGGSGPEQSVRVLFSRPMREMGFGTTGLMARDLVARIRLSDVAAPKKGDTVEIDDVIYRVAEAAPDGIDVWSTLTLGKA